MSLKGNDKIHIEGLYKFHSNIYSILFVDMASIAKIKVLSGFYDSIKPVLMHYTTQLDDNALASYKGRKNKIHNKIK